MSTKIIRGGTCRISFYPRNGLRVIAMGTPSIGIRQDNVFLIPSVTIDNAKNRIYADLTEADTIQLVENVQTQAQAVFTNDETEVVYRFPIHELTVEESVFENFYDLPESYGDED